MASCQRTLLVVSHLRWELLSGRPQAVLGAHARDHRVVFFEAPMFDTDEPELGFATTDDGVIIAVPHLPAGMGAEAATAAQRAMIDQVLDADLSDDRPLLWYSTPAAAAFSRHVASREIAYDCLAAAA